MKADIDDASEWLHSRKRKSPLRPILAGVVGIAVTLGGMHIAGEVFVNKKARAIAELASQEQSKTPIAEIIRPKPVEKDWDAVVERVAKESEGRQQREAPKPEKQTVFTDATYVPKGADNVVSYTPIKSTPAPQKKGQSQPKVVVVGKPDPKLSDYCWGKEGSIKRRNCKQSINLNSRNQ